VIPATGTQGFYRVRRESVDPYDPINTP
jgi:hypothetical protein